MKKIIILLILTLAVACFAFTSCDKTQDTTPTETNDTEQQNPAQDPEQPQIVTESANEAFVFVDYATEQLKEAMEPVSIFYDETDSDEIAIFAFKELEDFEFIEVEFDGGTFRKARTLDMMEALPNSNSYIVHTTIPEGIPSRGISFTDGEMTRYYYISWSGMDGSLYLEEFDNIG